MKAERFGNLKPISGDSVLYIVSFRDLLLPGVRQYDRMKTQIIKPVAILTNKNIFQ
jgi:hypothetical protein